MNARLGYSRHGNIVPCRVENTEETQEGRLNFSNQQDCTSDTCALLCHDDSSMDCPMETDHGRCSSFKRRTSQWQVPRMSRLESTISISSLNACRPHMEERMRRRLKYFFMNPCQKYQAKRRKPFKLVIQIVKIALVTAQLMVFGANNQALVGFKNQNEDVLQEAFLGKNESLITKNQVYTQIHKVRKIYAQWKNLTIGIFDYPTRDIADSFVYDRDSSTVRSPPMLMCVTSYSRFDVDSSAKKFNFDLTNTTKNCMRLKVWDEEEGEYPGNDQVLTVNGTYSVDFIRTISIEIRLHFVTMQVKTPSGITPPVCFNISAAITMENEEHSGKIGIGLQSEHHLTSCNEEGDQPVNGVKIFLNIFDCIIIITCVLSLVLCARSLWKAQVLRRNFEKFFRLQYNKNLSFSDQLEFFNMWYLLIIISDILTILGSIAKMILQNKDEGIVDYNVCSIFLGVGCLCVWVGVLRYVGFFHKYNILVLTLKKSLPHVVRFMVCASLLYLGFMFCGWVVLGPHHHKFRNLVVTSEALFSLINGDDMYMTYEEMSKRSTGMVVFSQVYLYIFISLFIYVVLSLFIAVIMDTYETIKDWQDRTEPQQTELEKFIAPCTADASVENYGFDGFNSPTRCCCCCFAGNDEDFYSDDDILEE